MIVNKNINIIEKHKKSGFALGKAVFYCFISFLIILIFYNIILYYSMMHVIILLREKKFHEMGL